MKDFKSYSSEQPENSGNRNAGQNETHGGVSQSQVNNTVEMAKIITKAMSGKSEGQILHTIMAEAERGKREGTLTNADLDNFYKALSPMLDGFKKKKLKEVIERLKNI